MASDDRTADMVKSRLKQSVQDDEPDDGDDDDPYARAEERFKELKDAEKQDRLAAAEQREREEDEPEIYDPEEEGNILH